MNIGTSTIAILFAISVFEDLRTRRFSNRMFMAFLAISLCISFFMTSPSPLVLAYSFGAAFAVGFGLFFINIIGAGDAKLVMALSPLFTWTLILDVYVYSLFWGAILGLIQIILMKRGLNLVSNLGSLISNQKVDSSQTHKIPYTVALLLGWIQTQTYPVLQGVTPW
jgi:Flp pilus assembly protein protease CpaA